MGKVIVSDGVRETLGALRTGPFSTWDVIEEYRARHAQEWRALEAEYGAGGKGAGQHSTVFTRIAQMLAKLARDGELQQLDYRPAPDIWGNRVIQYWTLDAGQASSAEQADTPDAEYREGSLQLKQHLRRERQWGLAKRKKDKVLGDRGRLVCERCSFDPGQAFGVPLGYAVIEVHHRVPLGESDPAAGRSVTLADLECLCANCHRLTHAEMRTVRP